MIRFGQNRASFFLLLFALLACGSHDKNSKSSQIDPTQKVNAAQNSDGKSVKRKARSGDTPDPKKSSGSGPVGGGTQASGGPEFFATTIKPIFQTMCVNCHADPRQPAEVRAPLSIYSYDSMLALLEKGGAPQDNLLWNTVRNLESHTGGDRCSNGVEASPCKEMASWWTVEFGKSAGQGTPSFGRISEVTALGRVYGWAFDPKDTSAQLNVTLYVDGPKGMGTMVGTVMANRPGNDGNAPGDHAFTFDLPDVYRNGKTRDLYAYAAFGADEKALSTLPTKYTAYAFSQAGRDFYATNVQGRLGSCGGCHTISYEQQFYSLITPAPNKNGTGTNNQLINKAAQTNGTSHGGGQSCGNANASPCAEFQRWWQVEFGGQ
jgi:cytochrome c553